MFYGVVRFFPVAQVLVVPFGMCWSLDVSASLVVVMGTESYDGREHKYVDYPVTDLLHMTGLASRCILFTSFNYLSVPDIYRYRLNVFIEWSLYLWAERYLIP